MPSTTTPNGSPRPLAFAALAVGAVLGAAGLVLAHRLSTQLAMLAQGQVSLTVFRIVAPVAIGLGIVAVVIRIFRRPLSFYALLISAVPAAAHMVAFMFLIGADAAIFGKSYALESTVMFVTLALFAVAMRPRNGA
jgi:hypothetical protein